MKANKPPRWASWLLARCRIRGDRDILLGDFEEEFHYLQQEWGTSYARRWYISQVLVSLPGFIDQMLRWSGAMLTNYLKVAVRAFRKQPVYSLINVVGLAIGLACCLLIFLFVQDELTFDRFHANADRIYRLEPIQEVNHARSSFTDAPTGPALVEAYPKVEAATRTFRVEALVSFEDQQFFGEKVAYVDSSFLSMFSFPLIQGTIQTALAVPNSIVLTASMAEKYFGEEDPMGQVVRIDNEADYTVTGVVEDVPHNSHYTFDALASFDTLYPKYPWLKSFGSVAVRTYLLLAPGVNHLELEPKFESFLEEHDTFSAALHLRPLTNIHLHSTVWEIDPQGDIQSVYLFSAIALFILLLACINYMNLSTARSAKRMNEVGMRKVLGADRLQLIFQFLGESIIMAVGALGLALLFVLIALPVMNDYLGRTLTILPLVTGNGLLLISSFCLAVGMLAGTYPAIALARFNPIRVLKKTASIAQGKSRLRQALVISQFVVSIVLLTATFVVGAQLQYMQKENLGFDQERVINIFVRDANLLAHMDVLKQELKADAQVVNVTVSSTGVDEFTSSGPITREADEDFSEQELTGYIFADEDYIDTFGMEVVAGRNFERERTATSSHDIIVNEALVRKLGWTSPEEAIGQRVRSYMSKELGTIIGVVKDFHVRSLRSSVPSVVLANARKQDDSIVSVRMGPGDISAALSRFEAVWNRIIPDWPFDMVFLDESLQQRYVQDRQQGQLFSVFSVLAIFIACLGLFGLAAFMAQQRTKEIGVRKVVGATVPQIILLLSKEFTSLVGIAFVVAVPGAYLLMDRWLNEFAFRIDLSWYLFALAGVLALGVAWLTVSFQSIRAARSNPVEMLRYE